MIERCLALAIAFVCIPATVFAQTLLEKTERDGIAEVARGDPNMEAAFRKAKATLPEFIALIRAPRKTITSYAVKVRISDRNGNEYFWVGRPREENGLFIGRIGNIPRLVKNVQEGELISFKQSDIFDWLYRENGRMVGNFTACALLKSESVADQVAFKRRYGLSCD